MMSTRSIALGRACLKLVASLLIFTASFLGTHAAAQTYRLVDLSTLSQGNATVVRGPNGQGTGVGGGAVVGAREGSGQRRGLLFEGGVVQQIAGLADSDDTVIFGLNDSGSFVGASNGRTAVRGFAGTRGGAVRELPPLPGDAASIAFAVNNPGHAIGFSSGPGGQRAVVWSASGTPAALPGSSLPSKATGINDRGDIAGVIGTAANSRAVLWPGAQAPIELAPLAGYTTSEAYAINPLGHVVGYSSNTATAKRRATLWPWSGGVVDLGVLPGGNFSQALGSNAAGDIVGGSTSPAGARAVLWPRGGGILDLNSLVPPSRFVLSNAVGINNAGMILATGYELPAGHTAGTAAGGRAHDETHELPLKVFLLVRAGGAP
jgi:probable HAF family extracellular repeat protein